MYVYLCTECDTLASVTQNDDGSVSVETCECVKESERNGQVL